MAPPGLRVLHCLICDDVRIETSYKETVVGIYTTGIGVRSLPWFAFVCVWMAVIWSGDGEIALEVRVLDPTFKEIGQTQGLAHAIHQGRETTLTFRGLSFSIESEGTYTIEWRVQNGSWNLIKAVPVVLVRT
jgi:hypothetical protein